MIDKQKLKTEVREELEALETLEEKVKDTFEEILETKIRKAMMLKLAGVRIESVKGLYAEALLEVNPTPGNFGVMDANAYRQKADAKPKDFYEKLIENMLVTFIYEVKPAQRKTVGYVYNTDFELFIDLQ